MALPGRPSPNSFFAPRLKVGLPYLISLAPIVQRFRTSILLACFFLSGGAALIYEVVWARKLALVFGSSALASSLILAAYLGGLALGARTIAESVGRFRRPALWYGALEILIGGYGLISGWLLDGIGPAYLLVQGVLPDSAWISHALQFVLVLLAILLPTAAMGATLPILVRADELAGGSAGTSVGRLYAVNTLGAVVGAAGAGFLLLPTLGLQGSLIGAASINAGLGLVVLAAFLRPCGRPLPAPTVDVQSASNRATTAVIPPAPALVLVLLSGLISLYFQVVWVRSLDLIFGSSTRAFSLMVATFLLGLAIGTGSGGWLARRSRDLLAMLGWVLASVGVLFFASGWVIQSIPRLMLALYAQVDHQSGWFTLGEALLCAAVMLPAAIALGIVFPVVVAAASARQEGARTVGLLYAGNTFGCIIGSLAGGLWLLPWLGIGGSYGAGACLALAAAFVLLLRGNHGRKVVRPLVPALIIAGIALVGLPWDRSLMTTGVYYYAEQLSRIGYAEMMERERKSPLLFYKEGLLGTVAVKQRPTARVVSIDGRVEGGTQTTAQVLLGHIGFALGRRIDDVFVIGYGTGNTAGATTLYPVRRIEVAELEPAMIEAARLFDDINHRPYDDPRVEVRAADGRNLLYLARPASYDLVLSQPSHPWLGGASKLFTQEFYRLVLSRLRPEGVFAQWMQLYGLSFESVAMLLNTFSSVFPHVLVVENSFSSGEVILVGSAAPLSPTWDTLAVPYADSRRTAELARIALPDPAILAARMMLTTQQVKEIARGAGLNTDDNSAIEFASLATVHANTGPSHFRQLRIVAPDATLLVGGIEGRQDTGRILTRMAQGALHNRDFLRGLLYARRAVEIDPSPDSYLVLGDILYQRRQAEPAIDAWKTALSLKPDNQAALVRLVRHFEAQMERNRAAELPAWRAALEALEARDGKAPPPEPEDTDQGVGK